jgi:hypothetical protein
MSTLQAFDRPAHIRTGRISVACRRAGDFRAGRTVCPLDIRNKDLAQALAVSMRSVNLMVTLRLNSLRSLVGEPLDSDGLDHSREAEEVSELRSVRKNSMRQPGLCQTEDRDRSRHISGCYCSILGAVTIRCHFTAEAQRTQRSRRVLFKGLCAGSVFSASLR